MMTTRLNKSVSKRSSHQTRKQNNLFTRPPCTQSDTGRSIAELMHIFTTHLKNSPSNYKNISETVSVSNLNSMSLENVSTEYCLVNDACL